MVLFIYIEGRQMPLKRHSEQSWPTCYEIDVRDGRDVVVLQEVMFVG